MIDTSNKQIQTQYDFIVVGAGAAGSVLAAELSASGAQVLIIESGGPDDAPTIANPSIWFYNVGGPLDYHLPVVPSPRLNDRKFNMALGHVLGGGTSINAMVWIRGTQADYDGWAENGAKGWAFADVLPVFKSQEDWEGGANAWRGAGGPIHIRRPKDPHPTAPAFLDAARQMGMPILDRTTCSCPASCSNTKARCRIGLAIVMPSRQRLTCRAAFRVTQTLVLSFINYQWSRPR